MQDAYLPGPGQLLIDIFTLGIAVIIGLSIWVIAKDYLRQLRQKWLWKRRRERWDRESKDAE
jgi:hypothetical protein